ncbi:carbohydrate-binding protein [Bacillus sp. JCM 19041]|uniref:carbohydrate-binding protein n=1 Tax=Bacillus sp. JCM 19041 TaxID=1460637 RepID=UPI0006D0ECC8
MNSGEWGVWKKAANCIEDEPGTPNWSATTTYMKGDQVIYGGVLYEAKWWTEGENPSHSGEWDVWKKIKN